MSVSVCFVYNTIWDSSVKCPCTLKLISVHKRAPEAVFTQKKPKHLYSSLVFGKIAEVREVALIPIFTLI